MFKIITFIVLGYILYRLVMPKRQIDSSKEQERDNDEFTDYEELD